MKSCALAFSFGISFVHFYESNYLWNCIKQLNRNSWSVIGNVGVQYKGPVESRAQTRAMWHTARELPFWDMVFLRQGGQFLSSPLFTLRGQQVLRYSRVDRKKVYWKNSDLSLPYFFFAFILTYIILHMNHCIRYRFNPNSFSFTWSRCNFHLSSFRGALKYYLHAYKLAIKDLTEAIAIDPNCDLAYFNRAVCYQEIKHYQRVSLPVVFPCKEDSVFWPSRKKL